MATATVWCANPAHQAVAQAQAFVADGYDVVVDIDLEKFFDRVNRRGAPAIACSVALSPAQLSPSPWFLHRAEAPRNRSTKSGHRLRFRIRQPARLLHVRRRCRSARRAVWIGRELERLVDSTAGRGRLGRGMKHACTRRRPAGEQPAGLFASITGVAERPAVGDSILPQWVGCPSCTFAATRSVSAAAAL